MKQFETRQTRVRLETCRVFYVTAGPLQMTLEPPKMLGTFGTLERVTGKADMWDTQDTCPTHGTVASCDILKTAALGDTI